MSAGAPAHYWVTAFLNEVWRACLAPEEPSQGFTALIKEMMAFGAQCATWRGFHGDDLELSLLCLDRFGYPRMEERHRGLLATLQPEWDELAKKHTESPYSARTVVDFLGKPVARDILAIGLAWLADRERSAARSFSEPP